MSLGPWPGARGKMTLQAGSLVVGATGMCSSWRNTEGIDEMDCNKKDRVRK